MNDAESILMPTDQPKRPSKAQQLSQNLFTAAMSCFMEHGYEKTTLQDIATAAGCSLTVAQRHFESKEVIVTHLYRQLATSTVTHIETLPTVTIAERFYITMNDVLTAAAPFRPIWQDILGGILNPNSKYGVLSQTTADVRESMRGVFTRLVSGASDAPKKPEQIEAMSMLLYVAYLMTLLFWISDRSPEYKTTYQLMDFSRDTLNLIRGALVLPPVTKGMLRLAAIVGQVFGA